MRLWHRSICRITAVTIVVNMMHEHSAEIAGVTLISKLQANTALFLPFPSSLISTRLGHPLTVFPNPERTVVAPIPGQAFPLVATTPVCAI